MKGHARIARLRKSKRSTLRLMGLVGLLATVAVVGSSPLSAKSTTAKTTLIMAVQQIQSTTDPQNHDSAANIYYGAQFMGQLVRWKRVPEFSKVLPGPVDVVGELASSLKILPDNSGVIVTLRPAKSQYGNTLSADDVVWTYDRVAAVKDFVSLFIFSLAGIDPSNPVTKLSANKVRINAKVGPLTVPLLTYKGIGIFDSTEAKKHATSSDPWARTWLSTHSATFAPYAVDSFTPSQELRLKANPYYNVGPKPYFKEIVIRAVPDSGTRLQLLKSGQVDWAEFLNQVDFASLRGNKKFQTPQVVTSSQTALQFNVTLPPFKNNATLRRAVEYAIDYKTMLKGPYSGIGNVPRDGINQAIPQPKPLPAPMQYNLALAKKLVKQSGYNGSPIVFGYTPGNTFGGADTDSVVLNLAAELRKAGLNIQTMSEGSAQYSSDLLSKGKFNLYLNQFGPIVADPGYTIDVCYASNGFLNGQTGYKNATMDSLAAQALKLPASSKQRAAVIKQALALVKTDVPAVPIIDQQHYEAFTTGIKGYSPLPNDMMRMADLHR